MQPLGRPGVDRNLDKGRDGHGPDPLALAHQVDEHPAAVALLDVPALERREFAAAQGAAQEHRENGAVPFSFGGLDLGLSEEVAGLFPEASSLPCRRIGSHP